MEQIAADKVSYVAGIGRAQIEGAAFPFLDASHALHRCAICTHVRDLHEPDSFSGMAPCEGVFHRDDDGRHFAYPCDCRDFLDSTVVSVVPELEGIDDLA